MRTSSENEGRRPRLLVSILLATYLVAACGTPGGRLTSPPDQPAAPGSVAATPAVSAQPAGTSPAPVPTVVGPVGRVPLVIREYSCDICDYAFGTTVLGDGRVIWENVLRTSVRRLSANGLARLQAQLAAIPELAANGSYEPTLIPGATPPAFGPTAHFFLLERGDRRIRVNSADAAIFSAFPDVWVTPEETVVLTALAERMKDPESWLPPDAWSGATADFTPDRYLLLIGRGAPGVGQDAFVDIDAVAWPFGPIASVGTPSPIGPNRSSEGGRCVVISADQARAMAAAEGAAGAERDVDLRVSGRIYRSEREHGALVDVELRWLLPYQTTDCRDPWNQ